MIPNHKWVKPEAAKSNTEKFTQCWVVYEGKVIKAIYDKYINKFYLLATGDNFNKSLAVGDVTAVTERKDYYEEKPELR